MRFTEKESGEVCDQIRKMRNALANARSSLKAFGGDPRRIYAASNGQFGDMIQVALLDEIDAALQRS